MDEPRRRLWWEIPNWGEWNIGDEIMEVDPQHDDPSHNFMGYGMSMGTVIGIEMDQTITITADEIKSTFKPRVSFLVDKGPAFSAERGRSGRYWNAREKKAEPGSWSGIRFLKDVPLEELRQRHVKLIDYGHLKAIQAAYAGRTVCPYCNGSGSREATDPFYDREWGGGWRDEEGKLRIYRSDDSLQIGPYHVDLEDGEMFCNHFTTCVCCEGLGDIAVPARRSPA